MDDLVSTEWLAANLRAADLVVLDASLHMAGVNRDARAEYEARHIPGAMAFVGVAPPEDAEPGRRPPLHNGRMTVHEEWLQRGVALHCAFATRFLARGFD